MKIETIKTSALIPYARNAKKHDEAQISKLAGSIREFGFNNPVLIDSDNGIIAGHGRVMAAQKLALESVPCIRLGHLNDAQRRAYILADNRLAEIGGGWDEEMLKLELADLGELDVDLDAIGFGLEDLEEMEIAGEEEKNDADAEPQIDKADELVQKWGVKTGQLWELGDHRLLCGDSTRAEDVAKLMRGEKAALLHADPPYGMGKEKDGVQNDNLYEDKLDAFQMEWWRAFRPALEDNASAYIWGNAEGLWRLWYRGGLGNSERLTMRNEIIWRDPSGVSWGKDGMSGLRMFAPDGERCLFFMLGEQGFNNNADNYWEGWEGIRSALEADCKKMGWGAKDIERICGVGMYSHWFTKSQWTFIPEEHYRKLQAAAREHDAFKREHDELKREHDELKREFYATRAHFDNTHDNMTDVWEFPRVTGDERHGHATPKPVAMMDRVMKSSLPKGGICVEPFNGSGSTLMGAERTGRKCRAIEISPGYVAVAIQRWADATGKEPKLIG